MNPANPVAAVVHPDPYPYYADLVAGPPLVFDDQLHLWIASGAAAVSEVLANRSCHVRPVDERVPKPIAGSPAGDVFSHLIRMNDGAEHDCRRIAVRRALSTVDLETLQVRTRKIATALAIKHDLRHAGAWASWASEVPVYTVADLLGFSETELPAIAAWVTDFVACLSPSSTEDRLLAAGSAAQTLLERFKGLLQAAPGRQGSLINRIRQEARMAGWDNSHALLANAIGLLSQTYDATAGLIGNSIVALLRQHGVLDAVLAAPVRVEAMVLEVSRFDPPVQNTRRFVAEPTSIAGIELNAGAAILVVLAAASRDPSANPSPDQFLLDRENRRTFGFGNGVHACPGQAIACAIATAAIKELLTVLPALSCTNIGWTYRPSVNGRIPLFCQ